MKALILGVSGQDGAYLAKSLLEKGYEVIGTSRDISTHSFSNLSMLGIKNDLLLTSMAANDFRSVLHTIKYVMPDEIYNLSGQSSVGLSFEQPVETMESILSATLNILEAIKFIDTNIKFYNAGSGECFGDTEGFAASEESPFRPRSPYAVAKSSAFWMVNNYRTAYSLFVCTGILFNHESPLRADRFVTQKIVKSAYDIFIGKQEHIQLGNINIERDWGWAPDYVEAMWKMLNASNPEDYIIATGKTVSLRYFIELVFKFYKLNWEDHVKVNESLFRPADIRTSKANPRKAHLKLGWVAENDVYDVVIKMCEAQNLQELQ